MGRKRKCLPDGDDSPTTEIPLLQRNSANARERNRMRVLSKAFVKLKTTLPWVPPDTKLSKLDTLRLATCYIAHLRQILAEDTEENNVENNDGTFSHPLNLSLKVKAKVEGLLHVVDGEERKLTPGELAPVVASVKTLEITRPGLGPTSHKRVFSVRILFRTWPFSFASLGPKSLDGSPTSSPEYRGGREMSSGTPYPLQQQQQQQQQHQQHKQQQRHHQLTSS